MLFAVGQEKNMLFGWYVRHKNIENNTDIAMSFVGYYKFNNHKVEDVRKLIKKNQETFLISMNRLQK